MSLGKFAFLECQAGNIQWFGGGFGVASWGTSVAMIGKCFDSIEGQGEKRVEGSHVRVSNRLRGEEGWESGG